MREWLDILSGQPLFGVGLTLLTYAVANILWEKARKNPFLNPVLVASAALALFLVALSISYEDYLLQAQPINETLAVIVVLLAVPLWRQFHLIRAACGPLLIALACGSVAALASTLLVPLINGADDVILATVAPKSATAAVAVQVSERLGGLAGLTAVIVISTGVFGAAFGPAILGRVGVADERALGFSLGVASHAIGTARAFQISETAGAFASLGMILHALAAVLLVPPVLRLLL